MLKDVRDWMLEFGVDLNGSTAVEDLYTKLVQEETEELRSAASERDIALESADLIWVAAGLAFARGVTPDQLNGAFKYITGRNFSKRVKNRQQAENWIKVNKLEGATISKTASGHYVIRNAQGKILKGPNFGYTPYKWYRFSNLLFFARRILDISFTIFFIVMAACICVSLVKLLM